MLTMTENAIAKVTEYQQDDDFKGKPLRVFVEGGGCSGFVYGLAFDEKFDDDTVVSVGGVQVVIDPASAALIGGAEVDFVDTLNGSGFKVSNPQAKSTCGCGQSFSV